MKLFKTLVIILCLAFISFAQTDNKWTKIESKEKDFSIAFPQEFNVLLDKSSFKYSSRPKILELIEFKNLRSISVYQDGVSMWMESYDVKSGEKAFRVFLNKNRKKHKKSSDFKFPNYSFREVVFDKAIYHKTFYFHTKKKVYLVGAASNNPNNPTLLQFVKSIQLYGKQMFKGTSNPIQTSNQSLTLDNLESSPLEIIYAKDAASSKDKKTTSEPDPPNDNETPMVVIEKPKAELTKSAKRNKINDFVEMEVTFGSNGQVQKIVVLKTLKYGLTEKAINVVRRTKFFPQMKNNVPVSFTKELKYGFAVY